MQGRFAEHPKQNRKNKQTSRWTGETKDLVKRKVQDIYREIQKAMKSSKKVCTTKGRSRNEKKKDQKET